MPSFDSSPKAALIRAGMPAGNADEVSQMMLPTAQSAALQVNLILLTAAATLRTPAGVPSGSSSTGIVQHLPSQFERMTGDIVAAQVDLAMVWCYETDSLIQTGQSVTHTCNAWQTGVIRAANAALSSASW